MVVGVFQNTLHHSFLFLTVLVRRFLIWKNGSRGKQVSPITDPILKLSAVELASKIRNKELSSVNVLKAFIARVDQINPLLNCVVDNCFDKALEDAQVADDLIASGKYTSEELADQKPFLGVPISTKDNIRVKDLLFSAGLWTRRFVRAHEDGDAMALMREAGAIPFALTNVPELCMWWECLNPIFGHTNNPYDTNRISGGSSGGEGVIQSAGASAFGLGSDIAGSIRVPSLFNGIFGHKPTKDTVSLEGCFPPPSSVEQGSLLSIGPMSRFSCDLRPVLKVLTKSKSEILGLEEHVDIKNLRFFYQKDDGGGLFVTPIEEDQQTAMERLLDHLSAFATTKPVEAKLDELKNSFKMFMSNFKDNSGIHFDHQFANYDGYMNPWIELMYWIFGKSNHTIFSIFVVLMDKFEATYGSPKHSRLVQEKNNLRSKIQDLLGDNGVLIYPTQPSCALYHYETLIRPYNISYTAIFNCLGFPVTSVPLGLGVKEGLPTGVQIIGNFNKDRLCLAVAEHLETVFGGWVEPGKF
ncbi:FAAH2.2 family protein [Megaselia abdita]